MIANDAIEITFRPHLAIGFPFLLVKHIMIETISPMIVPAAIHMSIISPTENGKRLNSHLTGSDMYLNIFFVYTFVVNSGIVLLISSRPMHINAPVSSEAATITRVFSVFFLFFLFVFVSLLISQIFYTFRMFPAKSCITRDRPPISFGQSLYHHPSQKTTLPPQPSCPRFSKKG
jgi:hypothetical protein